MNKKEKEVKSRKDQNPRKRDEIGKKPKKVIIEYVDPVQVKKANPMKYEPCVFQALGWAFEFDYHFVLIPEISISHPLFEYGFPSISLIIPKCAIYAIWDINNQTLRSSKTQ